LLASARVLDRFFFFCALSWDWSFPPLEEAFARAYEEEAVSISEIKHGGA
jgi:hypothetical protein